MKTTHTPGPWETLPAARSNLIHIETSADHRAICSVPKSSEANARLIAAAPELLAALEEMCTLPRQSDDDERAYQSARAVIAKARGDE